MEVKNGSFSTKSLCSLRTFALTALSALRSLPFLQRCLLVHLSMNNDLCSNMTSFPGGSDGKESAFNAGDLGLTPGLGRPPGEGNGHPLQYSSLQNSMDRGAWRGYSPWGYKKSDMTEQLTLSFLEGLTLIISSKNSHPILFIFSSWFTFTLELFSDFVSYTVSPVPMNLQVTSFQKCECVCWAYMPAVVLYCSTFQDTVL